MGDVETYKARGDVSADDSADEEVPAAAGGVADLEVQDGFGCIDTLLSLLLDLRNILNLVLGTYLCRARCQFSDQERSSLYTAYLYRTAVDVYILTHSIMCHLGIHS